MSDGTTPAQPVATGTHEHAADPRAAADAALSAAVENWLRAHGQIPEGRDVVAIDYAVPFTVRWLTSSGRTGRRNGCVVPPEVENVPALGDMMLRRSQQLRFSLSEVDEITDPPVRRPSSRQRHERLPDCLSDHTETERCWLHLRSYGPHTEGTPSLAVWAHQSNARVPKNERLSPNGRVLPESMHSSVAGIRIELTQHTAEGPAQMWTDLCLSDAQHLGEDVLAAAERLTWAGLSR